MKVGILGGTFNPPHIGHLILAKTVKESLGLHKVLFVPANKPPHKNAYLIAPRYRLRMVRLAVKSNSAFEVLDWEIKRGKISYTIDTLRELKKRYPHGDFFLIIGSDLAKDFYTWKDYAKITKLAKVVVVKRENFPLRKKKGFITIDMSHIGINSSLVRKFIKKGVSIKYFVPEKVAAYIKKNNLYMD